jgi:bla regulator protein BlaR1
MRQDRELPCDAYVLSRLKPCEYKRYGAAIITILENYCYPFGEYVTTGFASGRTHMRQRIAMIASYKKRTAAGFVWGMTLFLLMGCLVLTNAKGMTGPVQEAASPELRRGIVYEDLSDYFKEYDGAFVLLDVESGSFLVHNDAGSRKRVSPDSTYKIMSSLIGLETGVLEDENTQMKWDGTVYPYAQWNKDQTLASAMESSASWYFQKLDAYVGKTGIENYLNQIGYGNVDLSGGMNDFWLESSLKISPVEQVKLLEKLYTYELPFSRRTIDIVKKAIKLSEQDKIALYGKTGTGIVNNDQLNGWFIGFVENEGKAHIFATNIQGKARTDGATARNITLSILNDKNILPGAL